MAHVYLLNKCNCSELARFNLLFFGFVQGVHTKAQERQSFGEAVTVRDSGRMGFHQTN